MTPLFESFAVYLVWQVLQIWQIFSIKIYISSSLF